MQKQASLASPATRSLKRPSTRRVRCGSQVLARSRHARRARTEAGKTFRTLVKEGSAVETKAIRDLSKRVETSVATATSLWRQTRATTMTAANTIAQNASAALSKFKAPIVVRSAPTKARKAVKATKKSAGRTTRRTKRATRKA